MKVKMSRTGWIVMLLLAAGTAGYLKLIFLPQMSAISQMRTEVESRRQFVLQANAVVLGAEAIEKKRQQALSYLEQHGGEVHSSTELAGLLADIAAVARSAGVTITGLRPDAVVPYQTLEVIPLHVGCRASFAQLLAMLAELERLPQPMWIEALRIDRGTETGGDTQCELNLAIFAGNFEDSDQVTATD